MNSAQTILTTIEQQKEQLRKFGLVRVGLFGSVARGEETINSDVDILLDFDPAQKTYRNFFDSTMFLEHILKRSVDAVTPQALSSHIRPHIEPDIHYVQIN